MTLSEQLQRVLENEEKDTVSDAFGGERTRGRTRSFSVIKIRDWLIEEYTNYSDETCAILTSLRQLTGLPLFKIVISNLIRFSFLIELTNLTIGSTKIKTKWMPGFILMPQEGSFEPIQGCFGPGNDPRASTFDDCFEVFKECLSILIQMIEADESTINKLTLLSKNTSFPYEFFFDYIHPDICPLHVPNNICSVLNDDILWLINTRPLIYSLLPNKQKTKIQTKTYKTDRCLTGRDKTNRAKRWEVLYGDFQHASLVQCWSVEKKLLLDLIGFEGFPSHIIQQLKEANLINEISQTKCPVTHENLKFEVFLNPSEHGRSEYQVGHLHPLKKTGNHEGSNVCWQSYDGNRIQGDLTIEETVQLLIDIYKRGNLNENT